MSSWVRLIVIDSEADTRLANERLRKQLAEIKELQKTIREQAIRDPLTGLFNRRYLNEILDKELARADREQKTISFIMMDIDKFKSFNDRYGHKTGDLMLKAVGTQLQKAIRKGDVACRYGGEEFLVLLPGASLSNAKARAEQLRAAYEMIRIPCDGKQLSSTLSIGVAIYPDHGKAGEAVLHAADEAMYAAKAAGRNCVVVWNQS